MAMGYANVGSAGRGKERLEERLDLDQYILELKAEFCADVKVVPGYEAIKEYETYQV